jgi:hypothetical protein
MDEFTPSQITIAPLEQSPLMNGRDPNSIARMWARQAPLHSLSQRTRVGQSQGRERLARLDKLQPVVNRDMFPFRVFNQPIIFQAAPVSDSNGPCNYRCFSVWTGNAQCYVSKGSTLLDGQQILLPEMVQVAKTTGYNFKLPVYAESYNEAYTSQSVGLYGGANSTETMFIAPPNCYATFWITWDANVVVNGAVQIVWPQLHFGGITYGGTYFGDANAVNFVLNGVGQVGDILNAPDLSFLNMATPYPQSFPAVLIATIQVGAQGAAANTGNDGITFITQLQHNHINEGPAASFRGEYDALALYFPGDVVHFLDTNTVDVIAINSSRYAIAGFFPSNDGSTWPYYGSNSNIYSGGQNLWSTVATPYEYATLSNFKPTTDFSVTTSPSDQEDQLLNSVVQLECAIDVTNNNASGFEITWYLKAPGGQSLSPVSETPGWVQVNPATSYAGTGVCEPNPSSTTALGTLIGTLNITNSTGMGGFMFYAQITEGGGGPPYPQEYFTQPVIMTTSPCCLQAPLPFTTTTDGAAMFWVVASQLSTDPLSYQWQRNGSNVSDGAVYTGSQTPQLSIANVASLSSGDQFLCLFGGGSTFVPSPPATLGIT